MPIYEFHCEECDELFEIRASIKEREEGLQPKCPKCQSEHTKQLISGVMVLHGDSGRGFSGPLPGCGPTCGPGSC